MNHTRMIRGAGHLAVAGGAAWLAKMAVIAGTDGRVTDTGAAAGFFVAGLVLLALGAATLTLRPARGRGRVVTAFAVLLGPLLFFGSFVLLEPVAEGALGGIGPAWLGDEAGILLTAVVWLAVGAVSARQASSVSSPTAAARASLTASSPGSSAASASSPKKTLPS